MKISEKNKGIYFRIVILVCLIIILALCVGCSLHEKSANPNDESSRSTAMISDVATAENSEREENTEKDDTPGVTDTPTPQPRYL